MAAPPSPATPSAGVTVLCDAAATTGLGHFVRCLALAVELAARGAQVDVALRDDALPWARDEVVRAGLRLRTDDWDAVTADAARHGRDLVVDSYGVTGPWLSGVHQALDGAGRLVVIDDLADRRFTADVVVNQNLGAEGLDYPGAGRVLSGPRHALLRAPFAACRDTGLATAADLPDSPGTVLVLFGGTDAAGMTATAGAAARAAFPAAEVRVIAPRGAAAHPELDRVTLLEPSPDVHTEMLRADLVVTAGGTTLWELCCLARPAAVVTVADNQLAVYDEMVRRGFVLPAGRAAGTSPQALADRLGRLVGPGVLRRVAQAASTVTDGAGTQRVADALAR